MSGAPIVTPNTEDTTFIKDGGGPGFITPGTLRQLNDSASALPISSTQTTSYIYQASDHGTLVIYNSTSPGTFTVPANTFQTQSLVGFRSIGTGQLTIAAGGGFTMNVPTGLTATPSQWITGFVHFTSATTGVLM